MSKKVAKKSKQVKLSPAALKERHLIAKRLSALGGNDIDITFYPGVSIEGHPDSEGHQFIGSIENNDDEFTIYIDGRQGELDKQLYDELRRIAEHLAGIILMVKARREIEGVDRSLVEPTTKATGKGVAV